MSHRTQGCRKAQASRGASRVKLRCLVQGQPSLGRRCRLYAPSAATSACISVDCGVNGYHCHADDNCNALSRSGPQGWHVGRVRDLAVTDVAGCNRHLPLSKHSCYILVDPSCYMMPRCLSSCAGSSALLGALQTGLHDG